ncbi:MAG: TetR/AcrR family transcriptional regulator [Sandaracinaceae bacterium]
MARPPTHKDEDLLSHAREVFLERGLRATTAEVAARAGVSEALLFKRFSTKQHLFETAMRAPSAFGPEGSWLDGVEVRAGTRTVPEHLGELALSGIRFFRKLMPLVVMAHSHLGSAIPGDEDPARSPAFVGRRRMELYFEGERRLGRLRAVDTEILARVFIGSLFNYAMWDMMFGAHDPRPIGPEAYARGLVDMTWRGIAPE